MDHEELFLICLYICKGSTYVKLGHCIYYDFIILRFYAFNQSGYSDKEKMDIDINVKHIKLCCRYIDIQIKKFTLDINVSCDF